MAEYNGFGSAQMGEIAEIPGLVTFAGIFPESG